MKLTEEEESQRRAHQHECGLCKKMITKGYCGYCDEYYNIGHEPDCKMISDRDNHAGHARY